MGFVLDEKAGLWLTQHQALEGCLRQRGLKLLLDTNVVLNAYALQTSRSSAIVESCRSGVNQGFLIQYVVNEARNRILRKCPGRILDFNRWLTCTRLPVEADPPKRDWPDWVQTIQDEDDRAIGAAADLYKADALITNDTDFAPVAGHIVVHSPEWVVEWRSWMPAPGTRVGDSGLTVLASFIPGHNGGGRRYVWDAGSVSLRIEGDRGKLVGLATGNGRLYEAQIDISGEGRLTAALSVQPRIGLRIAAFAESTRAGNDYIHCAMRELDPIPHLAIGCSVSGDCQLNASLQTIVVYRRAIRATKHIEALVRFGDLALEEYDIGLEDLAERLILLY